MINKIKNTITKVIKLIENLPRLADDDNKLVVTFWYEEIGAEKVFSMSAYELMQCISRGELTSSEHITRARRKVEELRPDLRGKTYLKRQRKSKEVRSNINK